jgi:hypothetical protein
VDGRDEPGHDETRDINPAKGRPAPSNYFSVAASVSENVSSVRLSLSGVTEM